MPNTNATPTIEGLACIDCGRNLAEPGVRSIPVGFGTHGQTFRCASGCALGARLLDAPEQRAQDLDLDEIRLPRPAAAQHDRVVIVRPEAKRPTNAKPPAASRP